MTLNQNKLCHHKTETTKLIFGESVLYHLAVTVFNIETVIDKKLWHDITHTFFKENCCVCMIRKEYFK